MTYDAVQMKSARIDLRISEDLKGRVVAEAERRGQKITTFIERALESALGPQESVVVRAQAGEFERASSRKAEGVWTQAEVAESFGVAPEPSSGCPECGGAWEFDTESQTRCADCGAPKP